MKGSGEYRVLWRPAPEANEPGAAPWFGRSDYTCRSKEGLSDLLELAAGEQGLTPGALLRAIGPRGGEVELRVVVDDAGRAARARPSPWAESWPAVWEGTEGWVGGFPETLLGAAVSVRALPREALVLAALGSVRACAPSWVGRTPAPMSGAVTGPGSLVGVMEALERWALGEEPDPEAALGVWGETGYELWAATQRGTFEAAVGWLARVPVRPEVAIDAARIASKIWDGTRGAAERHREALRAIRRELPLGMVLLASTRPAPQTPRQKRGRRR